MNKKEITLIVVMVLLSIVLVIGSTYAFYLATITGNDTAEDITIASGYLELTFDEGGSNINIEGALPTSKGSKTFTVENTSTANIEFNYNIKLSEVETDFEQKDLVYTLEEYEDDTYGTLKSEGINATGFINSDTINEDGEIYLAINIPAPAKEAKQYYKLTIEFKETNENQNYNFGKSFTGKINGDDNRDAKLYEPPKTFSEIMQVDNETIYNDDPGNNLRYVGQDPNNYIWFNCNDYAKVTDASSAQAQKCEKWRIIGLFKDIEKVEEEGNVTKQDLVKIVRSESIGNYSYDNKDKSTGAEEDTFGKNDWTTARLMMLLNPGYETESVGGSLYYDWSKGQSTKCYSTAKNGTSDCDFSETGLKNDTTRNLIENVIWHLGSNGSISYHDLVASDYYNSERGDIAVYEGRPTVWPTKEQINSGKQGKVGIIYPSDYGFATSGGETTSRESCLTTPLYHWAPSTNEEIHNDDYPDCYNNNWLYEEKTEELFLMPSGERPTTNVYGRAANGHIHSRASDNSSSLYLVRPSLYLKSNVEIVDGKGTSTEPYILSTSN